MCSALGFVAAAQGTPLDCLALVAEDACILVSHRAVASKEMVPGRQPSPQNCTDSGLR